MELGLNKEYSSLIKNREIFTFNSDYNSDRAGSFIINPITKDGKIFMYDMNYSIDSLSILAHELGHNVDLTGFLENNNCKDMINYYYKSNFTEVISMLFEKYMYKYLIDNGIYAKEVLDKCKEYYLKYHDYLLSSYIFSLLDDKYLKGHNYLKLNLKQLVDMVSNEFEDKEELRDYLEGCVISTIDLEYAYGGIVSTFLEDEFERERFDFNLFRNFCNQRGMKDFQSFFYENDLGPSRFNKLTNNNYQKILQMEKSL